MAADNLCIIAEYKFRTDHLGYWIDVSVDRQPWCSLGPYSTQVERQRSFNDLLAMSRSLGATDMPKRVQ